MITLTPKTVFVGLITSVVITIQLPPENWACNCNISQLCLSGHSLNFLGIVWRASLQFNCFLLLSILRTDSDYHSTLCKSDFDTQINQNMNAVVDKQVVNVFSTYGTNRFKQKN